jgi:predicted DNA-binding transcriptional regulator AlpA
VLNQEAPTPGSLSGKKNLVDIDEAAAFLVVPKSWLYNRTRRNAVPLIRLKKYVRFDLAELEAWARSGEVE